MLLNTKDKKGIATIEVFVFLFASLLIIIFLGVAFFMFNTITTTLQVDQDIGQVNLKNATDSTLGRLNTGFLNYADTIGYTILFGMILLMLVNAYAFRGEYPKLFIIIDLILLVFSYILSVYITYVYSIFINSTSILQTVYQNTIPISSTFILNLPKIVGIIGALIIILSYSGIPRKEEEATLGFT